MNVSKSEFQRETVPDDNHDASYLEQEGFEDRLKEYQRGDFGYIGIRAVVDLEIPTKQGGYITQRIESPGLWSIESDSDESYLAEVYAEECAQLAEMLTRLGVTVED